MFIYVEERGIRFGLNWIERKEILEQNNFHYIGDRYKHKTTNCEYWVSDLKIMTQAEFMKSIGIGRDINGNRT